MKILLVNCLDYRYGLVRRARTILNLLTDSGHAVICLEPNYQGSDARFHSSPQKDSLFGYLRGTLSRLKYCLFSDYELLFILKLNLLTFPLVLAGLLRRKKTIVDWDDLDSEFQQNSIRRFFTLLIEKYLPPHVPLITTHNELLQEYIRRKGAPCVLPLPQVVDTDLFNPDRFDRARVKDKLGLAEKTVIGYLGTLTAGGARDLDAIIDAFRIVRNHRPDLHLLIIGGGPLQEKFSELLGSFEGKNDFTITGTIPNSEVPFYLSSLDAALIFMRDNPGNQMRMSLKLLEYLAMNLIVIGRLTGASLDQLGKFCILREENEKNFASIILENLANRPKIKPEPRNYIENNYGVKNAAQALDKIFEACNR